MMREWMKRLIAIALCVTLVASLAACGNNSNKNPTNNTNSNSNGDETDDSSASSGILDDDAVCAAVRHPEGAHLAMDQTVVNAS